jgi:hypothetical protein
LYSYQEEDGECWIEVLVNCKCEKGKKELEQSDGREELDCDFFRFFFLRNAGSQLDDVADDVKARLER